MHDVFRAFLPGTEFLFSRACSPGVSRHMCFTNMEFLTSQRW